MHIYQLQSYFQEAYEYLIASQFSLYYLIVVDLLEILYYLIHYTHNIASKSTRLTSIETACLNIWACI